MNLEQMILGVFKSKTKISSQQQLANIIAHVYKVNAPHQSTIHKKLHSLKIAKSVEGYYELPDEEKVRLQREELRDGLSEGLKNTKGVLIDNAKMLLLKVKDYHSQQLGRLLKDYFQESIIEIFYTERALLVFYKADVLEELKRLLKDLVIPELIDMK